MFPTRLIPAVFTASSLTLAASAGPLQLKHVAADAQWVAHVDVEGFANSKLVQFVLKNGEHLDIQFGDLNDFKEQFGIDPFYDLKDITIYGQGYAEDNPRFVAIITTSPAVDAFIETITTEGEEQRTMELGGYTVHSFNAEGKTMFFHVRPGAAESRRVIVLSQESERLVRGISVVDGRSPNLLGAPQSLLNQKSSLGSLVFAAAIDIPGEKMAENNPASGVVRDTKAAMFNFAETEDQTQFELMIETDSSETATNVSDIIRGFLAMGKIAVNSDPELQPLKSMLNAVKLTTGETAVSIRFQQKTESILEMLKSFECEERAAPDKSE